MNEKQTEDLLADMNRWRDDPELRAADAELTAITERYTALMGHRAVAEALALTARKLAVAAGIGDDEFRAMAAAARMAARLRDVSGQRR